MVDGQLLRDWASFVARGLSAYHWEAVYGSDYAVDAAPVTSYELPTLLRLFDTFDAKYNTYGDFGEGTFDYCGSRNEVYAAWVIRMFGGIKLNALQSNDQAEYLAVIIRAKATKDLMVAKGRWRGSLLIPA